jgi:hypothetical protein
MQKTREAGNLLLMTLLIPWAIAFLLIGATAVFFRWVQDR